MSEMKPLKKLISLDEARKILEVAIKLINRTEEVPIDKSLERVCAVDVVAKFPNPPFARAAMDGYAVKARDTFPAAQLEPISLTCIGAIYAGQALSKKISKGQCIKIATGAVMPTGADAVVMVEDTETEGGIVKIFKPVYPKANVSGIGADIKKGDKLLKNFEVLTPSKIGVLAALGFEKITVYEKPTVSVMPTGDEVADLGTKLKQGQVYDVNSYTLSTLIQKNGCVPVKYATTKDTYEELDATVTQAIKKHDVVVLSGGSSVGERDILSELIENNGELLFHGVQIKPGKPTICGLIKSKLIFGMPGYPTACMTSAYVFLVPVLRKIAHLPPSVDRVVKAKFARRYVSTLGRHQFLTVQLKGDLAIPVFKESGAITSMANADGFVEIPPNVDLIEKGEVVEVKLI